MTPRLPSARVLSSAHLGSSRTLYAGARPRVLAKRNPPHQSVSLQTLLLHLQAYIDSSAHPRAITAVTAALLSGALTWIVLDKSFVIHDSGAPKKL